MNRIRIFIQQFFFHFSIFCSKRILNCKLSFILGVMLSEDPLNYDAFWKCENFPENCSFAPVSSEAIARIENEADKEIIEGPIMKTKDSEQGISFLIKIGEKNFNIIL